MQPGALRALEYHRIVDAVRSLALTTVGDARLVDLQPETDHGRVARGLAATSEGVRYLAVNAPFPLRAPADFDTLLGALAVEGRALEPLWLLGLADFFESMEHTRGAITRAAGSFPILCELVDGLPSFKNEVADVRHKIDPSGEVADHASPQLRTLRERLRRQRSRLRGMLESYLRGRDTAKYLQETVVTDRNGRYVLVVKSEHRSSIPGIVHGSSASGASLFLEPLSTVELNNEIVAIEEQEREEVHRILLELSDAFRGRPHDCWRLTNVAAEIDVIYAKARFAVLVDGVEPGLSADGHFELLAARHPLLLRAVTDRLPGTPAPVKAPVPVDVKLVPPVTVLVIAGPNTGGKTVALKTAGLLALMAQSGLHIPVAAGSRLPVFRSVFADIGDEQSISASLSTFSSHITNIAWMDRSLALPALVLLDEVGAGTDPTEGGALAAAIIDYFRQRGAFVVATTHYDSLKAYASTTPGVIGAAFGFEADTFAPTYELRYGFPGRSLAIEMAGRLGLNQAIVGAARRHMSARDVQVTEHLAKIDRDQRALDHERRLVAHEREGLAESAGRLRTQEEELRTREDASRRGLTERVEDRMRDARREIDQVIDALKRRTASIEEAARQPSAHVSTGEAGAARVEARAALDAVAERFVASPAAAPRKEHTSTQPPAIGQRVSVAPFGLEGLVVALHGSDVEVDMRGKRIRAKIDDLRVLDAGDGSARPEPKVNVRIQLQPREGSIAELNLVGCSVDQALARAEKFLDDALLTEQRTVRMIHGYGTGQLRRAIAEFLRQHPLVARFESATPEQGGGGVTVVELKD